MNTYIKSLIIHPIYSVLTDLTVEVDLINGTQVLLIYYILVLVFFLLDLYIDHNVKNENEIDIKNLDLFHKILAYLYRYYKKHGVVTINGIIMLVCICLIIINVGFEWNYIIDTIVSIAIFTVLMKLILRVFINRKSYENEATVRLINIICFIILGNYFCYNMNFITAPNLVLSLSGLTLALLFCVYIMIIAIFNPEVIQKETKSNRIYSQAFGILKGMIVVLICMLTTLFLMIYCCYKTDPNFYTSATSPIYDSWDLFYYLIISFTTIGYGDIVPVRVNDMFFSRYVAILIGLSSIFTTTCFVAAVISTTNSLAKASRDKENSKNLTTGVAEEKLISLINETLNKYSIKPKEKK